MQLGWESTILNSDSLFLSGCNLIKCSLFLYGKFEEKREHENSHVDEASLLSRLIYLSLWVVKSIYPVTPVLGIMCNVLAFTRVAINYFMLKLYRYLYGS